MRRPIDRLWLALAALGCDGESPPRPPREPPPRPVALRAPPRPEAPRVTEAPAIAPDDADALGRCVRRNREALGPELGRALAALHDEALLEDACALDLAVTALAPERCAGVRLSALRERCEFRASIAAGRPAACPAAAGLRGRDPVCVALAARDPSLCDAAPSIARARCLALAAHDPRPCEALDPMLRPECARDLDALAGPPLRGPTRRPTDPARNAWSTTYDDASVDAPVPWLLRGVFLDDAGALWIADPARPWPAATDLAYELPLVGVVAAARRGAWPAREARLITPGAVASLDQSEGTLRALVTLTHVPRARGDRVAGSVAFEGASTGRALRTTLRFDTFVRDVVPAAALR